jgi:tRNA A-37 threonylcarbamoyl transferase component Bud32
LSSDPLLDRIRQVLAPAYDVERRLGVGGMATVFEGVDRRLARRVAIKVLQTDIAKATTVERFRREARLLARLDHEGIVRVYEAGESTEAGVAWYIMELMRDGTLEQRLAAGALPVADVLRLGRELASALDAVHAAGVLHRDVKPANVFLSKGRALLGDFGVATAVDHSEETLTQTGGTPGTPAYMAPELIYGGAADERSDIWGLGATLYEAVTGGRWTLTDERHALTGIPPALRPALRRALARDPAQRWPTASVFAKALPRSRYRRWPAVAAAGLLGIGGAVAALWWYVDPPLPHSHRRVAVSSQLAVVPFDGPGNAGRRLSRYTAQSLEWYPLIRTAPFVQSASIAGEARAQGIEVGGARLRSAFYVTGELVGAPPSQALRLEVRDSVDHLLRVVVVPAADDDVAWGAAAADSILNATWPAHLARFRELSRRGTTNPAAAAAFVGCDDAFQLDDWEGAERDCKEAIRLDPGFPQALWTIALVHRWMRVPFDDDLRRLSAVTADLPRPYARLVRAQSGPDLQSRIDSFGVLAREYPSTSVASFLEYNELFHRGALLGIPLLSTVAEMQQRSNRDAGLWGALGDQLLWGHIRLGDREQAARVLERRLLSAAAATGGESADRARLLRLAFWARFEPFRAGLATRLLLLRADSATLAQLGRVFRFGGVPFDAPGVQRFIGARLSERGATAAERGAGAVGEAVALVALGRPDDARGRLDAGEMLRAAPDAPVARCEWRLALAAMGFYPLHAPMQADCRQSLGDRLSDPGLRARAAVTLGLDAAARGDLAMLGALDRSLRGRPGAADRRVGALIRAQMAAAGGHFADALDSTAWLRGDDSLRLAAGPFTRAALFLSRGEWRAAAGDSAGAAREWLWYENSDFESWPDDGLQAAEVDAMLAGLARLRRAEVLQVRSGTGCREIRRVRELWRDAEPGVAGLRERAATAARRCAG